MHVECMTDVICDTGETSCCRPSLFCDWCPRWIKEEEGGDQAEATAAAGRRGEGWQTELDRNSEERKEGVEREDDSSEARASALVGGIGDGHRRKGEADGSDEQVQSDDDEQTYAPLWIPVFRDDDDKGHSAGGGEGSEGFQGRGGMMRVPDVSKTAGEWGIDGVGHKASKMAEVGFDCWVSCLLCLHSPVVSLERAFYCRGFGLDNIPFYPF